MWTTQELKERAKDAFKANYWPCVLAGLVLIGTAGGRGVSGYRSGNFSNFDKDMSTEEILAIVMIVLSILAISMVIATVMKVFITNPLNFGCHKFFLENSYGGANLKEIVYAFSPHYKSVIATGFMRDLYLFLWGLLLWIPAIIKHYSYLMVPYIIADNPEMSANEAITRSREMMDGHKWNVFCMQLSFIGWFILTLFTLFILGVFYVNPWYYATEAELYRSLKGDDGVGRADDTFVPNQTYGNDYGNNNYGSDNYGSSNYGSDYNYDTNSYGSSSSSSSYDSSSTGYGSSYGSTSDSSSSSDYGSSYGSTSDSSSSSSSESSTSSGSGVSSSDFPSFSNDDDF